MGCGSSGDVWRGTVGGKPAAIKVFKTNLKNCEGDMWLSDECKAYKDLKHLQVLLFTFADCYMCWEELFVPHLLVTNKIGSTAHDFIVLLFSSLAW